MLSKILTQSEHWMTYSVRCNDNSNSIDSQAMLTSGQSLNSTQEVFDENVFDEASVADATIQEATNNPIINDAALARE